MNIVTQMLAVMSLFALVGWNRLLYVILIVSVSLLTEWLFSRELSKDAAITGLIIAIVLEPGNIVNTFLAPVSAILSKKIIRYKERHIFNPAAFGLIAAGLNGAFHSWWGAIYLWMILIAGVYIANKIRKFEVSISFLVSHSVVLLLSQADGANAFLNNAVYFIAFFMATEPKTTPANRDEKIIFGVIAGVISALLITIAPMNYPLIGLLAANLTVPILNKRFSKII